MNQSVTVVTMPMTAKIGSTNSRSSRALSIAAARMKISLVAYRVEARLLAALEA